MRPYVVRGRLLAIPHARGRTPPGFIKSLRHNYYAPRPHDFINHSITSVPVPTPAQHHGLGPLFLASGHTDPT